MYVTGARENYELESGVFNQTETNLTVFILLSLPKEQLRWPSGMERLSLEL